MKYIQRIQTLEILHGVLTYSMAEKETFQYKLKVMVIVQKDTKLKDLAQDHCLSKEFI